MDWTVGLVALVVCSPQTYPGTDELICTHYQNLPYVTCMLRVDRMNANKKPGSELMPACIRLDAVRGPK